MLRVMCAKTAYELDSVVVRHERINYTRVCSRAIEHVT